MKRQRDLNGARRFLLLECTELGAEEQMGGRSGADSILHVDFKQPEEMEFNRASSEGHLFKSGVSICVMPGGW